MAPVFRKITKRVFIIINLIVACIFLLACCNAFLHPEEWWFIALLGLAFPFLLIFITAFFLLWIIFRSRWAFLSLCCLLIGYTNIRALVGFNFGKTYNVAKPKDALRILTWNVTWFDEQTRTDRSRPSFRAEMFEFIRTQNPDVLCFQEYVEIHRPKPAYSNKEDLQKLGYKYSIIANDYTGWRESFHTGIAIFSKYPITDTLHVRYPGPRSFRAAESLISADIDFKGQKIRMFTTHLQSVLFQKTDYRNLEIIKTAADSMYEASKSVVKKLVQGYRFRGQQVDIVRKYLDESPYPAIICGDFNDVPNSYTYFRVKGSRKDAFTQSGRHLGRTFSKILPTLRIDYIMTDRRFDVVQYSRDFLPYSEHYPVIADVVLQDTAN